MRAWQRAWISPPAEWDAEYTHRGDPRGPLQTKIQGRLKTLPDFEHAPDRHTDPSAEGGSSARGIWAQPLTNHWLTTLQHLGSQANKMKLRIKKEKKRKTAWHRGEDRFCWLTPGKLLKQQSSKNKKQQLPGGKKLSEPRVLLYFLKLLVFNKIVWDRQRNKMVWPIFRKYIS